MSRILLIFSRLGQMSRIHVILMEVVFLHLTFLVVVQLVLVVQFIAFMEVVVL